MTSAFRGMWGRRKAEPLVAAKAAEPFTVTHEVVVDSMMADDSVPLAHRIGLALDQVCQNSGLKQWKWLKQMDIPQRAFLGWKTGAVALSFKSLERLLPAIGWTVTITDQTGNVIVQAPASRSSADLPR